MGTLTRICPIHQGKVVDRFYCVDVCRVRHNDDFELCRKGDPKQSKDGDYIRVVSDEEWLGGNNR